MNKTDKFFNMEPMLAKQQTHMLLSDFNATYFKRERERFFFFLPPDSLTDCIYMIVNMTVQPPVHFQKERKFEIKDYIFLLVNYRHEGDSI